MLEEFGLREGINEVIGITVGEWINTAPLGIIIDGGRVYVRLYENHTKKFVEKTKKLYINVIYDPIVFVKASFEDLDKEYFESLDPPIVKGALSWVEFEAELERNVANLRFLSGGVIRKEVRAINRGFNALIEALVNATRYVSLKKEEFKKKAVEYGRIIEKCGGKREKEAFKLLLRYLE